MAAIACSTRCGSPALGQKHFCRLFLCRESGQFQIWARMHSQYLVIPMCPFASNVIGSHAAPPDATLLHFFSKDIFRTMFFCMRSQKGTFKRFPTKWYTFLLFQSAPCLATCLVCLAAMEARAASRAVGFFCFFVFLWSHVFVLTPSHNT